MQQIELYCKQCKKSMKITYTISGRTTIPVMQGMTIRCHTNKCTRVVVPKNITEGHMIAQADAKGRCYI